MSAADRWLQWRFVQSFGDDSSGAEDLVTTVEYDDTGDYLAVGDKAGRVCIFEGDKKRTPMRYEFYTEFQSHEPQFDSLKSLEIEEKINMIKWAKRSHNALFLLATNDKTIKFWKVHEKKIKRPSGQIGSNSGKIQIPKMSILKTETQATRKQVYSNAHAFHINSIDINSDGETFISADDLRVNLWNLEVSNESFNILDVKPPNMEELTEVITSATFHPSDCNTLLYSSSRGSIRIADLRMSALCDYSARVFEMEEDPASKSFFSEIISSISDARFTKNGRYIISRDYLTLKVWDVKMESKPIKTIAIHDFLKMHLCDLYENDCIFDKFGCAASPDGTRLLTGSYHNNFTVYDMVTDSSITVEALKEPVRPVPGGPEPEPPRVNLMDFGKKAMHLAWHPSKNEFVVTGLNKLYIYTALNGQGR
eukprot:gb/GEZN01006226.1/.p1 GENE.gb/GEZN01006226.1/~~gb/GEZN01006226.1/.p1  ORF type:complete len:423 (+),score=59.64 gb/GEZN01006226.1/:66-1334(+)